MGYQVCETQAHNHYYYHNNNEYNGEFFLEELYI